MAAMNEHEAAPRAWRARWVIPVDGPPLEGGVVTVAGGRIVDVRKTREDAPVHDLGDVALLPGLINAHTHLEFSLLEQPLGRPGMSFPDWIAEVVRWRRAGTAECHENADLLAQRRLQAIARGLAESSAAGCAAIGEIAAPAWPAQVCTAAANLHATVFLELLGLDPNRLGASTSAAREYGSASTRAGGSVPFRRGLSPHAPYTVHPLLLFTACALSRDHGLPLAMHVAESREELQLLQSHAGPLVELLKSLEAWHPRVLAKDSKALDILQLLAIAHRSLVIHGNYLAPHEIEFLAAHRERMSVVYCPRTHAYFGHDPYPLVEMLKTGVRVAVGTDSRASSPDLRLFEELRQIARQHPTIAPEAILRMGTLAGAEALGLAELGSIAPGKCASLLMVPLGDHKKNPLEWMLNGQRSPELQRVPLKSD